MVANAGILYPRSVGPTRTDLVGQGVLKVPGLTMEKYKTPSFLDSFGKNKDASRALMMMGLGMMKGNDGGIWNSLADGGKAYFGSLDQSRDQFNEDQQLQNQNAQQTFQNQASVNADTRAGASAAQAAEAHGVSMDMAPLQKKQLEQSIANGDWQDMGNGWTRNRVTKEVMQPPKEMLDQILNLERAKANISAAASPTSYSTGNYMTPDGSIVSSRMSNRTGTPEIQDGNGNWVPAAPGGRFMTDGAGGVVTPQQFNKLENDVTAEENGLKQLVSYGERAGGLPQGIDRWANTVTSAAKTLFGSQLDKDEFNQRIAQGELQGLIGALRVDVLGPGVLTEQDAQRLIGFLGGDPASALQNPETLKGALQRIIDFKMNVYSDKIGQFNRSAPSYGVANKDVTDYGKLFSEIAKPNPPAGTSGVDFNAVDALIGFTPRP